MTTRTKHTTMIRTDFQDELMKAQREHTADLTDEQSVIESMKVLHSVVALTFNDLDISALTRMLSAYLIHSDDCDKNVVAEKANEFVIFAEYINGKKSELSVIDNALTGFEEGLAEEKRAAVE